MFYIFILLLEQHHMSASNEKCSIDISFFFLWDRFPFTRMLPWPVEDNIYYLYIMKNMFYKKKKITKIYPKKDMGKWFMAIPVSQSASEIVPGEGVK